MIPKIAFRYSWVYDMCCKEKLDEYRKKLPYPSYEKVTLYLKEVEKEWKKIENKILQHLSNVAKIKWKEKEVICYVNGRCEPISDPLTIEVYEKRIDWFIDVMIHELIHRIFLQDDKILNKFYKLSEEYNKNMGTTVHIIVNAIHKDIYLRFFNRNRLAREIKIFSNYPELKGAWDFVEKRDYKQIIKDFVS